MPTTKFAVDNLSTQFWTTLPLPTHERLNQLRHSSNDGHRNDGHRKARAIETSDLRQVDPIAYRPKMTRGSLCSISLVDFGDIGFPIGGYSRDYAGFPNERPSDLSSLKNARIFPNPRERIWQIDPLG